MSEQDAQFARAGGPTPPAEHAPHAARARRRGERWALAALLFPLFFMAVVGAGVYLMFHRQMGLFRPAHATGARDTSGPALALQHLSSAGSARGRA